MNMGHCLWWNKVIDKLMNCLSAYTFYSEDK